MTKLDIGDNKIEDISSLASATMLTNLGLTKNQISNLTPLKDLRYLMGADMGQNSISDITPLIDGQLQYLSQLVLTRQATVVLPSAQKTAFLASHPNCKVYWD